ncbi:uncharacterized protein [Venturia canescens]|uniref:uncharacterized protein n=1 Tax=Venturia canescens TaxID=32260 RepID=UPI001C9CF482|nr:uncharacterized protein LOC122417126 [Venturia canescens]
MLNLVLCIIVIGESTLQNLVQADGHGHAHHVIIHVPYKIKTIHHTHTITKHIHHKDDGNKDDLLGYTVEHPIDLNAHEYGHSTNGGNSAVVLDGHHFEGNHDSSGVQEFGDADLAGGISEGAKDSDYEGSSQGGIITSYDFYGSNYHRHNKPEFPNRIYMKREYPSNH